MAMEYHRMDASYIYMLMTANVVRTFLAEFEWIWNTLMYNTDKKTCSVILERVTVISVQPHWNEFTNSNNLVFQIYIWKQYFNF